MVKTLAHYIYLIPVLLISSNIFFLATVSAESLREFHERKCQEGNTKSCERAADMLEGEQHAERIDELGDTFASKVNRSVFEEDNKPLLGAAYPVVLEDYFKAEAESGIKQAVSNDILSLCSQHFNNHWRNRKMWWPTSDNGEPDWSSIYFYIVEHYYGYCLRASK